jgi:hypothetical protein
MQCNLSNKKQELGEEEPELSRTSKGNVSNQTKVHLKQLQDKTTV